MLDGHISTYFNKDTRDLFMLCIVLMCQLIMYCFIINARSFCGCFIFTRILFNFLFSFNSFVRRSLVMRKIFNADP